MPSSGRPRGAGSLWAFGLNYSLTGVFYNKTLAAKIGMTTPPTTLAQFDALLAKAKAGGVTPIVQFNGGATGGLLFPLQQLMAVYGAPTPINNWIFQKPGAKIDTPSNLAAATASAAVDQGRLLQHGRERHRLPDDDEQVPARRGSVHVRRRLGVGQPRQADAGQGRLLPDADAQGGREAHRDVCAADVRDRGKGEACRLRGVLLQLDRHQPEGAQDRCRGRRLEPRGPGRACRSRCRSRAP